MSTWTEYGVILSEWEWDIVAPAASRDAASSYDRAPGRIVVARDVKSTALAQEWGRACGLRRLARHRQGGVMTRHHCCRTCAAKRSPTDRRPRRWALTDKGLAAISAPLPDHVDVPVLTPAALQLVADENRDSR